MPYQVVTIPIRVSPPYPAPADLLYWFDHQWRAMNPIIKSPIFDLYDQNKTFGPYKEYLGIIYVPNGEETQAEQV